VKIKATGSDLEPVSKRLSGRTRPDGDDCVPIFAPKVHG
jgi:hypothetical protein